MEQVGEVAEEEEGDGKEEGELAVVTASGPMEAAGQIDLNDADHPTAPEEEPQPQRKEPVSAAARLLVTGWRWRPAASGRLGGRRQRAGPPF